MDFYWHNGLESFLRQLGVVGENLGVAPVLGCGVLFYGVSGWTGALSVNINKNITSNFLENDSFLFDLASLTKPFCTLLCCLHLVQEGTLSLEEELGNTLSLPLSQEIRHTQLWQLLGHCSGLPAYNTYYRSMKADPLLSGNRKQLLDCINQEELVYSPGKKCIYSDLGYILLGWMLEEQLSCQLNKCFDSLISAPLGLEKKIFFRPYKEIKSTSSNEQGYFYAPTGWCQWRNKIMQAEVQDEHCWLLSGVSGHAGLFGSTSGVMLLCAEILQSLLFEGKIGLRRNLMEQILRRKVKNESWCIGFDTPSEPSSAGKFISQKSIGHLGYTGTSFWIDIERKLIMVLLTNRVHLGRDNLLIRTFRPWFHEQVIKWFDTLKM
ncbi:MAG: serine hydrolase [Desulfobulbus propionicus]|nr:MAG: serine hydrolase [Desulfobulbus propionicus]